MKDFLIECLDTHFFIEFYNRPLFFFEYMNETKTNYTKNTALKTI